MRREITGYIDSVVFDDENLWVKFDDPPAKPQQFIFGNKGISYQEISLKIGKLSPTE